MLFRSVWSYRGSGYDSWLLFTNSTHAGYTCHDPIGTWQITHQSSPILTGLSSGEGQGEFSLRIPEALDLTDLYYRGCVSSMSESVLNVINTWYVVLILLMCFENLPVQ